MQLGMWVQDVLDHLQEHMDSEREVLRAYGTLIADCDERIAYLGRLILEDEVGHHRLFSEMANALRSEHEGRDHSPRVPGDGRSAAPAQLRGLTEELLKLERADARKLRALRRDLEQVEDTAWWGAIVATMEADTKKHVRLLEAIRDLIP